MKALLLRQHRVTVAVSASMAVHLLAAALVVGSSLWRGWPATPVDVEITGMRLEDLHDLPLGVPASGEQRSDAVVAPEPRAPRSSPASSAERDPTQPKPRAKAPRHPPGPPVAETDPKGGAGPPRPTSVRSYAPQGSRVTALLRVDRLRGTSYAPAVDALLMNLPDRQDLLEGTGVDLYADIDAVLIATPNPLDPRVTFLAARHRLTDGALRAALERGALATHRKLTWRTERGRPFAERRATGPTATDLPGKRDHRLILLPAPHLVVVTPPAYRSLILRGGGSVGAASGGRADEGARPDGGAAGDAGAAADGGRGGDQAPGDRTGQPQPEDQNSWAALLRRIDAEDSIMPADAVAMVSASDLFSARTLRGTLDVVPGTRGSVDDSPPPSSGGGTGTILGLPVPRLLTATLGITPQPFADVDAEFAAERDAVRWQQEWPTLKHKLLSNPLVVLSGFSALIGRITVDRAGATIHVHLDATEMETTRILQLLAMQLGALRQ